MHELVERKEGDLIKNIFANLEIVRILDPDAHLLEALIKPIQIFIDIVSFLTQFHRSSLNSPAPSLDVFPHRGKDLNE